MPNLPLELLLNRWEQEVRPIEPSTRILIQEILHSYGQKWMLEGNINEIGKSIGPVLARNAEEQQLFRRIFSEEFLPAIDSSINGTSAPLPPLGDIREKELDIHNRSKKNRLWAYLCVAILFLLINNWFFRSNIPTGSFTNNQELAEQDYHKPHSKEELESPTVKGKSTQSFNDVNTEEEISLDDLQLRLDIVPSYAPLDTRRKVLITSKLDGRDHPLIDLGEDLGKNFEKLSKNKIEGSFQRPGIYAFPLEQYVEIPPTPGWEDDFGEHKLRIKEKVLFVPSFNPDAQEYRDFHLGIISNQQNWMKVRIFVLLILLLLFAEGGLGLWKNRQRKLAFRMEFGGTEDGKFEIPFDEVDKKLKVDPQIAELAVQLSLRRKSHLQKLDVPETIRETIVAAGMPQLVYQPHFKTAEYVALMEDDGKLPIYREFIRQLHKQDIPIKSYVYDIDKGLVYDEKHPEGIRLNKLNYIMPHSQMILFSDGYRLLDPVHLELKEEWKEEIELWEDKILITPVLTDFWSKQEEALSRYFQLIPTYSPDKEGRWEIDRTPQYLEKKKGTGYDFTKPEDVKAYLGEELFTWLSASMLHPKPRYEVLMAVGHALAVRKQDDFVATGNFVLEVPEDEFVSLTNLIKIYSLPWMKEGEAPREMKEAMLADLDKETELLARQAIVEELHKVETTEGTTAFAEKNTQLVIHQSHLSPENKLLQQKLRYLWKEDKLEEQDKALVNSHNKFQRFQVDFPIRQTLLAISFAGFITWMGVNFYQNQPAQLVEKYLKQDNDNSPRMNYVYSNKGDNPLQSSHFLYQTSRHHPLSELESIQNLLQQQGAANDLSVIWEINKLKKELGPYTFKENPEIYLLLDWYKALAILKTGDKERAMGILNEIEKSENRFFQQRVFLLRWDLQKPWYRKTLPVRSYLNFSSR